MMLRSVIILIYRGEMSGFEALLCCHVCEVTSKLLRTHSNPEYCSTV